MITKEQILSEYFGHSGFRDGQAELIEAILSGRDALGIMPTGGGKSVCYQVPGIMLGGVTVVISPLISLMKDQIHSLKQAGVAAAYINSTLSDGQIDKVIANAAGGQYKIIYVAPERLASPRFISLCTDKLDVPLVAVDEAHCVSQWGQDFRPSYTAIAEFISRFKKRPVVAAFTATATPRVRVDIADMLELNSPLVSISGFDRKNLYFEVRHPKNRYNELKAFLFEREGLFGIVYCSTRKTVEEVCASLRADGFSAARYHAGLEDAERHGSQDGFIYGDVNIIVATNAFGMGIDKSNVSFVVHYNMPKDVESYYQEAGRAGRDGSPADCVLLYSGQDLRTNLFLISNAEGKTYESEEQRQRLQDLERARLKQMDLYCQTNGCLRNYILKYFGEERAEPCGSCGSCDAGHESVDITETAQKILSCVVRMREAYGKNTVIDVLRGSKSEKILNWGLDRLPTYGICRESAAELKEIMSYLLENGYLRLTDGEYPILKLGVRAGGLLTGGERLSMAHDKTVNERAPKEKKTKPPRFAVRNAGLYARLKEVRRGLADKQGVPAYVIFHDSALAEMSERMPSTLDAFSRISGVGLRKLDNYGSIFIDAIKKYKAEG